MILTAKVEEVFPIETGKSKSGKEWKKGAILVDVTTSPSWPKKLLLTTFGKCIENIDVKVGQTYDFDIEASSREWTNPNTGKTSWFTEVSAFKAVPCMADQTNQSPQPQTAFEQANAMYQGSKDIGTDNQSLFEDNPNDDDLPF